MLFSQGTFQFTRVSRAGTIVVLDIMNALVFPGAIFKHQGLLIINFFSDAIIGVLIHYWFLNVLLFCSYWYGGVSFGKVVFHIWNNCFFLCFSEIFLSLWSSEFCIIACKTICGISMSIYDYSCYHRFTGQDQGNFLQRNCGSCTSWESVSLWSPFSQMCCYITDLNHQLREITSLYII